MLFFGLLLSISCLVDARINTPPANANTLDEVAEMVQGVRQLFQGSHRSLGGGVELDASSLKNNHRQLAQTQSWARNDDGNLYWWIWLIIGLSCGLCCIICSCAMLPMVCCCC